MRGSILDTKVKVMDSSTHFLTQWLADESGVTAIEYGLLAALIAWLVAAASVTTILLRTPPPRGTRFEAASQTFSVPGSVVPLLLILGIFMTKYVVGLELAMNASLAREASFAVPIALLYGGFNGISTARALRLLGMVGTHTPVTASSSCGFAGPP